MVYLWNWKAIVNAYYRGSFNSIWELPFWFPSSDIFCYWLCYIKKIYEWVSCRNLYSLFGAFIILQSISMVLVKFLNADFFIVIWIVSDFVILKIAPVNNSRIHLVQSEIFVLQKRLYYVLAIVNLICIVLISLPVTKELFSVLKGLTAALALDALTLVIFALKGIYRRIFYGNQHEKSDEKISQKYD